MHRCLPVVLSLSFVVSIACEIPEDDAEQTLTTQELVERAFVQAQERVSLVCECSDEDGTELSRDCHDRPDRMEPERPLRLDDLRAHDEDRVRDHVECIVALEADWLLCMEASGCGTEGVARCRQVYREGLDGCPPLALAA